MRGLGMAGDYKNHRALKGLGRGVVGRTPFNKSLCGGKRRESNDGSIELAGGLG